ncbi:MAG: hypothetical protein IJO53_09695, partial [Clostridia bacterium]|nr:hypothetical protein [Clostridia bacterium]
MTQYTKSKRIRKADPFQAINKPQEELFTRPWLSLWESCRHSRLRGEILRFSGSEMIKQRA